LKSSTGICELDQIIVNKSATRQLDINRRHQQALLRKGDYTNIGAAINQTFAFSWFKSTGGGANAALHCS
jgi:hypothetical protein